MSAQPIPREAIQELATSALSFTVTGTAPGTFFAAVGLSALGSLLTLGSLFLFMGIGAVMAVLIALSLSLQHAAHQLPSTSLPSEVTAQQKHETRRVYWVQGSIIAVLLLEGILLGYFDHREFIAPTTGFIVGIGFLLTALLGHIRFYYPLGTAHTLLGSVALLALIFGVTFSRVYIWTVVAGLGSIVIFWLTILYLLSVGRRLLSQERSSYSSGEG